MGTRTRKPAKPFVLKNIKANDLQVLLNNEYACSQAKEWAAKKSLKQVFKSCKKASWLNFLLYKMTGGSYTADSERDAKWGGITRFQNASIRADKAYERVSDATGSWQEASKAGADVYREHYTVV